MKLLIAATFLFCTTGYVFGAGFTEGLDYTVDFQAKTPEYAAVLHVNFTTVQPDPEHAEAIVKEKLQSYGKLIDEEKTFSSDGQQQYKNIIGSAWYIVDASSDSAVKIKFAKDLSAYVRIGKTKKTVPFPAYISFLKKEKETERKKQRNKAKIELANSN
jgi:hypothetical protein